MMNFNKKEQSYLKDLQKEEKLCVEKYEKAAGAACDPCLQQMLQEIGQAEQHHYDTVTQMLNGTVPEPAPTNAKSQPKAQKKSSQQPCAAQNVPSCAPRAAKQNDAYLVKDLLATEKFVSGEYNTSVFEFADENVRQTLSGILQQEQHHGKQLYDYLSTNNMVN